ncbi:MAG: chorismate lyase [Spongiibacteraceae bacterium]
MYADDSRVPVTVTPPELLRGAARQLRWRDGRRYRSTQIPALLRPWLFAEGSLTQRLLDASAREFRVQVLAQCWQRPTLAEARLLDIDPTALTLVREVILYGRGQPWVYARSILPEPTLTGDLRRLRKLQNSSLGALLFTYPQLRRRPFELATSHGLWGRRSRFEVGARALIVSEFFLPDFLLHLHHRNVPAVAD